MRLSASHVDLPGPLDRYHPRLDDQETARLIKLAQRGDQDAMERLILGNIGLVRQAVGKYAARQHALPSWLGLDDLEAVGVLGFVHAVEKYSTARGTKLSTYAYWWIRQSMQRYLEKNHHDLNVPGRMIRFRKAIASLIRSDQEAGGRREAEWRALAKRLNVSIKTIERAAALPRAAYSLDEAEAGGDRTHGELLAAPDDTAAEAETNAIHALVRELVAQLPPREAQALRLSMGLHPATYGRALTNNEVGEHLGVTGERARQYVTAALERLRAQPAIASLRTEYGGGHA